MKFRLKTGKGSVSGFTDAKGVKHVPGDIVELPEDYEGERWLEKVEPDKPQPTMQPVEDVKPAELEPAPLGKSKKPKS